MNGIWTLGLLALLAPQGPSTEPPPKKPATLQESIAAALRSHPDVLVAEAEVRVAEAKLAQAKLLLTHKITAAHAQLAAAKADVTYAELQFKRLEQLRKNAAVAESELSEARARLEQARASLAMKQAALDVLIALPTQATTEFRTSTRTVSAGLLHLTKDQFNTNDRIVLDFTVVLPPQPVADKLKAALDTPLHMDKRQGVDLDAYLNELLKQSGVDVKVRLPATENKQLVREGTKLNVDEGTYPLRVWLQLALDEANSYGALVHLPPGNNKPSRYDLYLREYGLLVSTPELAPPDAMTLQQFWTQVQAEKVSQQRKEEQKK